MKLSIGAGMEEVGDVRIDAEPYSNVTVQADAERLPFKDASFDIVYAGSVFEHLRNPGRMLDEVYRVLKPGGVLDLTTDHAAYWRFHLLIDHATHYTKGRDRHYALYSPGHLKAHCEAVGFDVVDVRLKYNISYSNVLERILRAIPWLSTFAAWRVMIRATKGSARDRTESVPAPAGARALDRPSYSLIVPTKDRSYHLARRLPLWLQEGYDEILIVDGSRDRRHWEANERLCEEAGVRYVFDRSNRSEARNLGARLARGTWIVFCDDDGSLSGVFRREVMDQRVAGRDWVKAGESEVVCIFRRDFFLELGGFRANLVIGEDDDLTARAIEAGRGGPVEGVFGPIRLEPDVREQSLDFKRRLANYMEYSLTLWEYAKTVKRPGHAIFRWCLEVLHTGKRILLGDMRAVPYFLGAVGGLAFGPVLVLVHPRARPSGS